MRIFYLTMSFLVKLPIKTATFNAASLPQVQNSLGQIQKGFIADIIAVPGTPLEYITLLQHVDFVMKEGKVIKRL